MCGIGFGIACMTTIMNIMILMYQIIKNPLYSLKLKKKHILGEAAGSRMKNSDLFLF